MNIKKALDALARHNLIYILIIVIILPIVITLYISVFGKHHIFKWTKGNYRLYGVTEQIEKPPFDWQHIKSHEVQKYLETTASNQLPLRSWLIRTINQFYFTVFKKSYAYNNSIIVGKKNQFLEKYYVYSYCGLLTLPYDDTLKLTAWADKLKQLSDFFTARGKTFVYLITPNKVLYLPTAVPNRYHCKDHETQHIRLLQQLLDARKVAYVNALDTVIHPSLEKIPLFPQGGTHWNQLAAALFANQIISTINQMKPYHLAPIIYDYTITHKPHGSEHDLTSLMNLLKPNKNYPVPLLTFKPNPAPYPPVTISVIGGSFVNQLLDVFHDNKTFAKMDFYFYLKVGNLFYDKDQIKSKPELEGTSLATIKDILHSDIIVLEENASTTISNHGDLFYQTLFTYYKMK